MHVFLLDTENLGVEVLGYYVVVSVHKNAGCSKGCASLLSHKWCMGIPVTSHLCQLWYLYRFILTILLGM